MKFPAKYFMLILLVTVMSGCYSFPRIQEADPPSSGAGSESARLVFVKTNRFVTDHFTEESSNLGVNIYAAVTVGDALAKFPVVMFDKHKPEEVLAALPGRGGISVVDVPAGNYELAGIFSNPNGPVGQAPASQPPVFTELSVEAGQTKIIYIIPTRKKVIVFPFFYRDLVQVEKSVEGFRQCWEYRSTNTGISMEEFRELMEEIDAPLTWKVVCWDLAFYDVVEVEQYDRYMKKNREVVKGLIDQHYPSWKAAGKPILTTNDLSRKDWRDED